VHQLSVASTQTKGVALSSIPMTTYSFVTPVERVATPLMLSGS
jgi:hypothetical protein